MIVSKHDRSEHCPTEPNGVEQLLRRFDREWRSGARPNIEDFLVVAGASARSFALLELVLTDIEYRFKAGESVDVLCYLARFPELACDPKPIHELIDVAQRLRRQPRLDTTRASQANDGSNGEPSPRLGRFVIIEPLGAGACGAVYKAFDPQLDRTVAIKIPHVGSLATPDAVERFLREARSAAQLRHPLIVPVYDSGQVNGTCFLVSELIPGETLAKRLQSGPLQFRQAAELMAHLADAIQYAHERDVIHRDIKPANILIDEHGLPHVMDFGLARRSVESTLTEEGQLLGTPAYISPEQARGEAHRVDGRTDVYSMGAVFYEMLTGEPPFRGSSRTVLIHVLQDEPRLLRRVNERIPRDLATICHQALNKESGRRYQTAAELAADLRRFLASEPVRARPIGRFNRLARWCRRRPLVAGLAVALLLAMSCGLSGILWQWHETKQQYLRAEQNYRRAEQNLHLARRAVDEYFARLNEDDRFEAPTLQPLRKDLLQISLNYYHELLDQHADDPTLAASRAEGFYRVAFITAELGDRVNAIDTYRGSLPIWKDLFQHDPDNAEYEYFLAKTYCNIGLLESALGHNDDALDNLQNSLAIRQRRAKRDPNRREYQIELAETLNFLSHAFTRLDQFDEAIRCAEKSCEIDRQLLRQDPTDPAAKGDLAYSYSRIGSAYHRAGRDAEAIPFCEQSIAIREDLVKAGPLHPKSKENLAGAYLTLANVRRNLGSLDESLRLIEMSFAVSATLDQQLATRQRLREEQNAGYVALAAEYCKSGMRHRNNEEATEAQHDFEQVLRIGKELTDSGYSNRRLRNNVLAAYYALGMMLQNSGDTAKALLLHQEAIDRLSQAVCESADTAPLERRRLASIYFELAKQLRPAQDLNRCLEACRSAIELERGAFEGDSKDKSVETIRRYQQFYEELKSAQAADER